MKFFGIIREIFIEKMENNNNVKVNIVDVAKENMTDLPMHRINQMHNKNLGITIKTKKEVQSLVSSKEKIDKIEKGGVDLEFVEFEAR